ncbi:ABC transporter ATP-binding protein [Bacillus marinisedimentorum]|uniref:ABC transporter ATP-binding protein n=1 Tax=Bacillus marinisedimentorum TaxID=1821260 RepID=UPI0007E23B3F|nr:dipeptide ABC transporter ATP-binding protein [Bacillus marinisedimentorum]
MKRVVKTLEPLLEIKQIKKHFPINQGLLKKNHKSLRAVDGVNLELSERETYGLVGESGCGKSTLGRMVVNLLKPTSGEITFYGKNISDFKRNAEKEYSKNVQMIFQDPYSSLNPRQKVIDILKEPLTIHRPSLSNKEKNEIAMNLIERVGLSPDHASRFPHQFSGGQRQRIGIARAVALEPKLIVCDEPVSALDVSIQSQIINLLKDLQKDLGISYLFIAHDLGVVKHISDRIAVMYLGNIVEVAPKREIFAEPLHPYTQALLSSIPKEHPNEKKDRIKLKGELPSPSNPPNGCKFHTRCPIAEDICKVESPNLEFKKSGHKVACHFA